MVKLIKAVESVGKSYQVSDLWCTKDLQQSADKLNDKTTILLTVQNIGIAELFVQELFETID